MWRVGFVEKVFIIYACLLSSYVSQGFIFGSFNFFKLLTYFYIFSKFNGKAVSPGMRQIGFKLFHKSLNMMKH